MTTYVLRNGKLVEKHLASPRSTFIRGVISDNIPDLVHPANGKRYSSKSTFRKVTKAYGYQEVGTEKQRDRRVPAHQDFSRDVVEAVKKLNDGYRPGIASESYSGDGWQ
jgi:hypothetical protein